ncbi:hypothetical protein GCM10009749_12290 [Agromyces neolithicus]|uniref:Peptidase S33 tripeptidyl aminopeptidase-like C-terminal domain-containing protein n=1 Tax=Agromyces neolithicus TaxID=269420 RepID=A0ABN2M110_9MICO
MVGIEVSDQDRRETAELRRNEPWYAEAFGAFERIWSGHPTDDDWDAIEPFMHGRWDAAQQAQVAREASLTNTAAAAEYYAPGALEPEGVRSAIAHLDVPVLLIAGELDVALPTGPAAAYASLFPRGELVVVPNAGHSPWQDNPRTCVDTIARFLG